MVAEFDLQDDGVNTTMLEDRDLYESKVYCVFLDFSSSFLK